MDTTIDRVNSGRGTLGQLLVNPSMYENVNGFTSELNSFIKEFRSNPKKFLTVRVSLF